MYCKLAEPKCKSCGNSVPETYRGMNRIYCDVCNAIRGKLQNKKSQRKIQLRKRKNENY